MIVVDGYMPLTLNISKLDQNTFEKYTILPTQEFLVNNHSNLNQTFMNEIEKQNRDLKIFEQL